MRAAPRINFFTNRPLRRKLVDSGEPATLVRRLNDHWTNAMLVDVATLAQDQVRRKGHVCA